MSSSCSTRLSTEARAAGAISTSARSRQKGFMTGSAKGRKGRHYAPFWPSTTGRTGPGREGPDPVRSTPILNAVDVFQLLARALLGLALLGHGAADPGGAGAAQRLLATADQ